MNECEQNTNGHNRIRKASITSTYAKKLGHPEELARRLAAQATRRWRVRHGDAQEVAVIGRIGFLIVVCLIMLRSYFLERRIDTIRSDITEIIGILDKHNNSIEHLSSGINKNSESIQMLSGIKK
jgi:hypothetical protein